MKISNCCTLCLQEDENNVDNLIWIDSMQLCENCYNKYQTSIYDRQNILINSLKRYRRKIAKIYETIEIGENTDIFVLKNIIEEIIKNG